MSVLPSIRPSNESEPAGYESDTSTNSVTLTNSPLWNSDASTEVESDQGNKPIYGIIQIGYTLSHLDTRHNFPNNDSQPGVHHTEQDAPHVCTTTSNDLASKSYPFRVHSISHLDSLYAPQPFRERMLVSGHNSHITSGASHHRAHMKPIAWDDECTAGPSNVYKSQPINRPFKINNNPDDETPNVIRFHLNDLFDLDYDADASCADDEQAEYQLVDSSDNTSK